MTEATDEVTVTIHKTPEEVKEILSVLKRYSPALGMLVLRETPWFMLLHSGYSFRAIAEKANGGVVCAGDPSYHITENGVVNTEW